MCQAIRMHFVWTLLCSVLVCYFSFKIYNTHSVCNKAEKKKNPKQ